MIIWQFNLQLPMQSVPITTDVVSSNLDQGLNPRSTALKGSKLTITPPMRYHGFRYKELPAAFQTLYQFVSLFCIRSWPQRYVGKSGKCLTSDVLFVCLVDGVNATFNNILVISWQSVLLVEAVYRCLPRLRCINYRYIFGRDSDLEAFSHNPSDGSFAPLAYQPST